MYKELVVATLIIIAIFSFDYVLQKYTDDSISEISDKLIELENNIRDEKLDSAQIETEVEDIYNEWMGIHDKLVYYIEHDELEKVETNFVSCKSFIKSKEYSSAMAELEKTVFVLDHINDKYSFNLENIF